MRRSLLLVTGVVASAILLSSVIFSASAANRSTIRIYVDGAERAISTDAQTVGEALKDARINVEDRDLVEPGLDAKIEGTGFNINIFRARPVLVEDQGSEYKVYTAQQSPKLIAKAAGLQTYDEDSFKTEVVTDFIKDEYIGQKVVIDRAVPLSLLFDGEELKLRTQAETVGNLLKQEGVVVRDNDQLNFELSDEISSNMKIIVVRVGHRLQTTEEAIDFKTEIIYDTSKPVDWSETQQKGKPGVKIVSYEINKQTGKKTPLQTVVKSKPVNKVLRKGSKSPKVSVSVGLENIKQCESGGNYQAVNPAGYYGAYQFGIGTWNSTAQAAGRTDLVGIRPDQATSNDQDAMAVKLHSLRGFQPWGCSPN